MSRRRSSNDSTSKRVSECVAGVSSFETLIDLFTVSYSNEVCSER